MEIRSVWSFSRIMNGLLRYTLTTVLLSAICVKTNGCEFEPSECPSSCQCILKSNGVHVNCSSSGLQSWPDSLPSCSAINLDISKNQLTSLEYRFYMNVTVTIDASHNSITSVSKNFMGMSNLKNLFLHNNELTSLSDQQVTFMKKLNLISLHDNHWDCQCKIKHLHDWIRDHDTETSSNIQNENAITCFIPRSVYGRPVGDLDDEVMCKGDVKQRNIPVWIPIVITVCCLVYLAGVSAIGMCIVLRRREKITDAANN